MEAKILKTMGMEWQPHPTVAGLQFLEMLSRHNDQAQLTRALVRTPLEW